MEYSLHFSIPVTDMRVLMIWYLVFSLFFDCYRLRRPPQQDVSMLQPRLFYCLVAIRAVFFLVYFGLGFRRNIYGTALLSSRDSDGGSAVVSPCSKNDISIFYSPLSLPSP